MHALTPRRTLALLEGDSDVAALEALARRLDRDLGAQDIHVRSAHGVTNFARLLVEFFGEFPRARACGMYDAADARHVRRALAATGRSVGADESLESVGFFACSSDLEDELIRASGPDTVQRVLQAEGELASFRLFQAMPQHRRQPLHDQLHRFLGTRATRKIRLAQRLVEVIDPARMPRPLALLMATLFHPAGNALALPQHNKETS